MSPEPFVTSRLRVALGYGGMLVVAMLAFLGIRALGAGLGAPAALVQATPVGTHAKAVHGGALFHVLLALLVVIVASRLLGALSRRLGQPVVIGEVLAGILLGPSLLGRVAPGFAAYVFPPSITPLVGVLAQVGVIVFMFLVGLELDTSLLRKKGESALAISHASIVAPFLLGGALALWLYPRVAPAGVRFDVFAAFMGVAMSVTAFPVLARILTDRGMQKTRLGVLALSCAAVDDVTAWCLLALVVGAAESRPGTALFTLLLTAGYIAFMFFAVRPRVHRAVQAQAVRNTVSREATAIVIVGLLVSALITEAIGIHAIFGAFLVGAMIPHDSRLARTLESKLEDLVIVLFLPAFFAFTGLRTQIALVNGLDAWVMCGAIVLVACLGKLGGTYVAARLTGVRSREAARLGVLMNTRGLMELVVLNIGLDLGVISPVLFAMMVVMALVTTFATAPLLSFLSRGEALEAEHVAPRV